MKTNILEKPKACEVMHIPMILGKEITPAVLYARDGIVQNQQIIWSFRMEKLGVFTRSEALGSAAYTCNYGFHHFGSGFTAEGLLAASHANSFTVFLEGILRKKGFQATSLFTEATVAISGSKIVSIHLFITGVVRRITSDLFILLVKDAQKNCPMSKLVNVAVTSEVILSLGFSRH